MAKDLNRDGENASEPDGSEEAKTWAFQFWQPVLGLVDQRPEDKSWDGSTKKSKKEKSWIARKSTKIFEKYQTLCEFEQGLNMRATHYQQKQILDLCSTCAWSTGRTLPSQSPGTATLQAIPWKIGDRISFKKCLKNTGGCSGVTKACHWGRGGGLESMKQAYSMSYGSV